MKPAHLTVFLLLALTTCASALNRVKLDFYGESLCPDCTRFTSKTLKPLFEDGVSNLFELRYYGWGNVRIDGSDRPACQHGPLECKINRVLNCGQHYSTNQDVFFNFLFCVESSVELGQDVEASVPGCAKTAGIVLSDIEDCSKGGLGDKLEQEAHEATDALKPAHQYVPWVVVNGIPIGEQADFVGSYICAAYNGTRPEACYQLPGAGQIHQPVMLSH